MTDKVDLSDLKTDEHGVLPSELVRCGLKRIEEAFGGELGHFLKLQLGLILDAKIQELREEIQDGRLKCYGGGHDH